MKMNKQVVAIINLSKDGVSYLVHCSQCHHLIQAAPTDAPNSLIYECEQCGYYNIADKDRIPKDRQRRINYLAREP
jgi:uncharacterized Zn finger protein